MSASSGTTMARPARQSQPASTPTDSQAGKVQPRGHPAHSLHPLKASMASSSPYSHPSLSAYHTTTSTPRIASALNRKKPSSESNTSSIDNAEKWFTKSNSNAQNTSNPVFLDSEPPFYLGSGASVGVDQMSARAAPTMTPPTFDRTPLFSIPVRGAASKNVTSDDSNSEDFRSVIDDLTIENKKLKQKLRKYERLHASHLEAEKLFEVKVHGLPPAKQAALEDALRAFAAGLDIPTDPAEQTTTLASSKGRKLTANNLSAQQPPSSLASGSRPLDSAYASLSASGAASSHPSGLAQAEEARRNHPSERTKKQNIQSYLHNMPAGLTRQIPTMTEESRKKLVVRRLEQLFTGKAREREHHSSSRQQQEVSQSAAHADRTAKRANGVFVVNEGKREAYILPSNDSNMAVDSDVPDQALQNLLSVAATSSSAGHYSQKDSRRTSVSGGGEESPNQRPTRPLDLDLQRAQNPADNIEYIRHLGLSSPKLSPISTNVGEEDGWVYLNLLTNMAQLHTINVTPEFVRKAVAEVSAKFDISHDGRKIRWRGGHEGTQMSSESGSGADVGSGSSAEEQTEAINSQPNKRRKTNNHNSTLNTPAVRFESPENAFHARGKNSAWKRPVPLKEPSPALAMEYRPIFHHQSSSSDRDDANDDQDSDEPASSAQLGRTGPRDMFGKPGGNKSAVPGVQRAAGGSLIFYRNTNFCTDLGGLQTGILTPPSLARPNSDAIGLKRSVRRPAATVSSEDDSRQSKPSDSGSEHMSNNNSHVETPEWHGSTFDFSPLLHPTTSRPSSPTPLDLEVSGIGGVMPDDNFAITVATYHPILDNDQISPFSAPRSRVRRFHHRISESALSAFHHDRRSSPSSAQTPAAAAAAPTAVASKILFERHIPLNPSNLPPPSFAFFSHSGEDDEDSDSASVNSALTSSSGSSKSSLHRNGLSSMGPPAPPPSNPRNHLVSSAGTGSVSLPLTTTTTRTFATDESSEIDLLAPARALDPETIARREREFDSVLDNCFLKELPAGSSAATAGGGGGWESEYCPSPAAGGAGSDRALPLPPTTTTSTATTTATTKTSGDHWCNPWGAVAGPVRVDSD